MEGAIQPWWIQSAASDRALELEGEVRCFRGRPPGRERLCYRGHRLPGRGRGGHAVGAGAFHGRGCGMGAEDTSFNLPRPRRRPVRCMVAALLHSLEAEVRGRFRPSQTSRCHSRPGTGSERAGFSNNLACVERRAGLKHPFQLAETNITPIRIRTTPTQSRSVSFSLRKNMAARLRKTALNPSNGKR